MLVEQVNGLFIIFALNVRERKEMKSYTPPLHFTERKATRSSGFSYHLPLHTYFFCTFLCIPFYYLLLLRLKIHTLPVVAVWFFSQHHMESFRKIAKNNFKAHPLFSRNKDLETLEKLNIF